MAFERQAVVAAGGLACAMGLSACSQATAQMQPGVPLEVHQGYCLSSTEYKQRGQPVNRDGALKHLAQQEASRPYVSKANAFAVASIGATIVATSTLTLGLLGSHDAKEGITMSEGTKTALIVTGFGVGVLSWVMCIASDDTYASAAKVYNKHLDVDAPAPDDDGAAANPASSQNGPSTHDAAVVHEPGDDGNYWPPGSPPRPDPNKQQRVLIDPRNQH